MTKPDNAVIDEDFISKTFGNDKEFKKEVFELFIETSSQTMENLKKALEENDNKNWYIHAHALKGSTASIGAFTLSKIFNEAQSAAIQVQAGDKSKIYQQALSEYQRLINCLKQQLELA